jgi:CRISPR-associated endonuclease/helicase Cas3
MFFDGNSGGGRLKYYAHSTDNPDKSNWQTLEEHLEGVAGLASEFAEAFRAGDWGQLAGQYHDAGKASNAFQKRLEGSSQRVDHSTYGARQVAVNHGQLASLLAYIIAGHHGGLPNGGLQEGELQYRLKYGKVPTDTADFNRACKGNLKVPFKMDSGDRVGFRLSFFTRMLFSCLVDADFLDTEAFCCPEKSEERGQSEFLNLSELKGELALYLDSLEKEAEPTPVNLIRQRILSQCRTKAKSKPQIFSLTVPTGGGKTLSSLAFALDHAVVNDQRRVIYAIPFTSIIEQNAGIFQGILGRDQVLEHHCNYKESDDSEESGYDRRRGLLIENWDAPVVVTTNVQLFESLFSNKPSRCRKLHNIAGSVIILDEAQAIPPDFLEPCLEALRELVESYNCTVVLCTATQPALDDSAVRNCLVNIEEIVDQPQALYGDLRRTSVQFVGKLTDEDLAARIDEERQILCIVSTKAQARSLYEKVNSGHDAVYHLSTNMYPEHRRDVLDEIRQCLKQKKPCRVISTSLVEAGVDLDFPVVYRAMAGLDSIAQAAGRCNREGKMDGLGQVFVYEPETIPRMPWIKRCSSRAAETLRALPDAEPIGLETMRRYFELLYDVEDLDKKGILSRFPAYKELRSAGDFYFPFKDIAEVFQFIQDDTVGVVIPAGKDVEKLIQSLHFTEYPRKVLRKLQPYTVSVRQADFVTLNTAGALEVIEGQIPVLRNLVAYKEAVGLCVDQGEVWKTEDLIQ